MDLKTLTPADLDFLEGFFQKCAELGLDPEQVAAQKVAAEEGEKEEKKEKDEKKPGAVKRTASGAGKGALAGGAVGAALGGVAMPAILAGQMARHPIRTGMTFPGKVEKVKAMLAAAGIGAAAGGIGGATQGAMLGGVVGANK